MDKVEGLQASSGNLMVLVMMLFSTVIAVVSGCVLHKEMKVIDALVSIHGRLYHAYLRAKAFALAAEAKIEDHLATVCHKAFDQGQYAGEGTRALFTKMMESRRRRKANVPLLPTPAFPHSLTRVAVCLAAAVVILFLTMGCAVAASEGASQDKSLLKEIFPAFYPEASREPRCVVVLLDASVSSAPQTGEPVTEFEANRRAVAEAIIPKLNVGDRLDVFVVSDDSFQRPRHLLHEGMPDKAGEMGLTLMRKKKKLIKDWEEVSRTQRPNAKMTDIFGGIALAKIIFQDNRESCTPNLIFLSDMRHATREINLERTAADPGLVARLREKGLLYDLRGVGVWVLGAHHIGRDPRYYEALKAFWQEYFKESGARLMAFTPQRGW